MLGYAAEAHGESTCLSYQEMRPTSAYFGLQAPPTLDARRTLFAE